MTFMKHLFLLLLVMLPLSIMAQDDSAIPTTTVTDHIEHTTLFQSDPRKKDNYYLEGAVPVVAGKVVFALEKTIEGASATKIYDSALDYFKRMMTSANQLEGTKIVTADNTNHRIVAHFNQQLVFEKTALSTDYTLISYDIIAKCSDGHICVSMTNIRYAYEMDREDGDGMVTTAEEWITDEHALNKKHTRLRKYMAKFRIGTIDLKDNIFNTLIKSLNT